MDEKQEPLLRQRLPKKQTLSQEPHWRNHKDAWAHVMAQGDGKRVIFQHLQIATDGGLSEIHRQNEAVWHITRHMKSLYILALVFYNIYYVLLTDLRALFVENEDAAQDYLITKTMIEAVFPGLDLAAKPRKFICVVELLILLWLCIDAVRSMYRCCFSTGYAKWSSTATVFWSKIPSLSVFSCIRLLHFVAPMQLVYDLNHILCTYKHHGNMREKMIEFLATRVLALVLGLDCFLLKYRQTHYFILVEDLTLHNVLCAVMFMNQIMGVVQMSKNIRRRLYRFVFAGEDGVMEPPEHKRKAVWEAMVAYTIFERFDFVEAISIMFSWSDTDFQRMTLNDNMSSVVPDGTGSVNSVFSAGPVQVVPDGTGSLNAAFSAGPVQAPSAFDRLDKNHDGAITRQEFAGATSVVPQAGEEGAEVDAGGGFCISGHSANIVPSSTWNIGTDGVLNGNGIGSATVCSGDPTLTSAQILRTDLSVGVTSTTPGRNAYPGDAVICESQTPETSRSIDQGRNPDVIAISANYTLSSSQQQGTGMTHNPDVMEISENDTLSSSQQQGTGMTRGVTAQGGVVRVSQAPFSTSVPSPVHTINTDALHHEVQAATGTNIDTGGDAALYGFQGAETGVSFDQSQILEVTGDPYDSMQASPQRLCVDMAVDAPSAGERFDVNQPGISYDPVSATASSTMTIGTSAVPIFGHGHSATSSSNTAAFTSAHTPVTDVAFTGGSARGGQNANGGCGAAVPASPLRDWRASFDRKSAGEFISSPTIGTMNSSPKLGSGMAYSVRPTPKASQGVGVVGSLPRVPQTLSPNFRQNSGEAYDLSGSLMRLPVPSSPAARPAAFTWPAPRITASLGSVQPGSSLGSVQPGSPLGSVQPGSPIAARLAGPTAPPTRLAYYPGPAVGQFPPRRVVSSDGGVVAAAPGAAPWLPARHVHPQQPTLTMTRPPQ